MAIEGARVYIVELRRSEEYDLESRDKLTIILQVTLLVTLKRIRRIGNQ
jgi:hypothetical protein